MPAPQARTVIRSGYVAVCSPDRIPGTKRSVLGNRVIEEAKIGGLTPDTLSWKRQMRILATERALVCSRAPHAGKTPTGFAVDQSAADRRDASSPAVQIRKFIVALVCLALPLQALALTGFGPRIAADVAAAADHAGHAHYPGQHGDGASDEMPRDCEVCGDCTPCLYSGGVAAISAGRHLLSAGNAASASGPHAGACSFTPDVPKRPPLARSL